MNPGEGATRKLGKPEAVAETRPWRLFTKNTGLCKLVKRMYRG